jgi:hypothetical protein
MQNRDKKKGAGPSRRELLAGTAGAVAATAAASLVRIPAALADDGDPVILGATNTASETTSIFRDNAGGPALHASSTVDDGAILGENLSVDGYGMRGVCQGSSGIGVLGLGGQTGVYASGADPGSTGLYGIAEQDGVFGTGNANGVHGKGLTVVSTGVFGENTGNGTGVLGSTIMGTGVHAAADDEAGTALKVEGKATFTRSGKAIVPSGSSSVTVSGVSLTAQSLVLATVQVDNGASVNSAVPNAGGSSFTINLTKKISAATPVAWFVVN